MADHPTAAFVDLIALSGNLDRLRAHLSGQSRILAIVKANAYGHGLAAVARSLESAGVEDFGVAFPGEGIQLRQAGVRGSILVMGGFMPQDVRELVEFRLKPVIYHPDHLGWLSAMGDGGSKPLPVHIKVDTGMGRLGLSPEEVLPYARRVLEVKGVRLEGLMTHFSDEDLRSSRLADGQVELFRSIHQRLRDGGITLSQVHMANTGALLSRRDTWWSMVRPGLALYGYAPSKGLGSVLPLQPVLTLKSRITQVRRVPSGTAVSYGGTFVTRRESVIGVVPMGYADGYPRALSNRGEVLVRGQRAPIIGRVCMDMFVVDLTEIASVRLTEEAVLIGSQGDEIITAADLAEWAGTIPYEILSTIGGRIPRIYPEEGESE
jgi:alanine racemase